MVTDCDDVGFSGVCATLRMKGGTLVDIRAFAAPGVPSLHTIDCPAMPPLDKRE